MPSRRDCVHCVRSQGRGKQHRRVTHPEAFTLSVDLSGKMTAGYDQGHQRCRYMLIACYTFPVTGNGDPLIDPPGASGGRDQDHPLPPLDADDEILVDEDGDDVPMPEDAAELQNPEDPLHEQSQPQATDEGPAQESTRTAFDVWHKLVEEATDVGVKNLTFVEVLNSRSVKDVLPALARISARLHALGLPLLRIHCDRARELTSAPIRRWTLDRGIITTMTTGSSFKANGRVEAEVGVTKRAVRTLISAKLCPLDHWPLAARHIGERRLRCQLQRVGWPTSPMLQFGAKAFAPRKSWQERWRDAREPVIIMGPDKFSSLTTTSYYVRSLQTGRFFYTDDVVQPPKDAPLALPDGPAADEDPVIYLEERGETALSPPWPGIPSRRLRGKTSVPAVRSMQSIEGEMITAIGGGAVSLAGVCPGPSVSPGPQVFQVGQVCHADQVSQDAQVLQGPQDPHGSQLCQSSQVPGDDTRSGTVSGRDGLGPMVFHYEVPAHLKQFFELEDVDGSDESSWSLATDSENTSAASQASTPSCRTDVDPGGGESAEAPDNRCGYMWLPVVSEAIQTKDALERQLKQLQILDETEAQKHLDQEFLITKTVSNMDVWKDLESWAPSARKEFEELVNKKQAVRQVTRAQLRDLAASRGVAIEILPAKMVHTRKAGSGAYRSRAVVCGNYADPNNLEHYAGGADTLSPTTWQDTSRLLAMEVPHIFKKLQLAGDDDVWIIERALYGLTSSPRDWSLHRDSTIPSIHWVRHHREQQVTGSFVKTPDDHVWRLQETNESGDTTWVGLMTVYVDDLLIVAEDEVITRAAKAISEVWELSELEKVGPDQSIKYCGFEIEEGPEKDGFVIHQHKYEAEMIQRFNIEQSVQYPNFKVAETDDEPENPITAADIKQAQSMAGALLWLSTRTRPDIAFGVASACKLATKNPVKSIEISTMMMRYVKGKPGALHYPAGVPAETWGPRNQLKVQRHVKLLEVFADIAYAAGGRHRSLQGLVVCFAGVPVAWLSSQQAFVTYSTAEAELVSYCEALNAGRSLESILCSMLNETCGNSGIERIIYGDNLSAIALAHGTGTASWRTRHLRVRASYLKEALDGIAPGGLWKLLHLRGTELVADGLTKPLLGQAFSRFLQNLGMRVEEEEIEHQPFEADSASLHGTPNQAAVRALRAGSILMSQSQAASESAVDEAVKEEFDGVLVAGTVLLTLGAVYAGQLAYGATKVCKSFCLRRVRRCSEGSVAEELVRPQLWSQRDQNVVVISEDESNGAEGESSSLTARSGFEASSQRPLKSGGKGRGEGASTSLSPRGRSGCEASGSGPMRPSSLERVPPSGFAASSSGIGAGSSSMRMSRRSGLSSADESATSLPMSTRSGSHAAAERTMSLGLKQRSGLSSMPAAGNPADLGVSVVSVESSGSLSAASVGDNSKGGLKGSEIRNPWNLFQHVNRQRGMNSTALAKMYKEQSK
eukprot:s1981_g8.t1